MALSIHVHERIMNESVIELRPIYWVEVSLPIEKYFKKIHKYPIQNDIAKELIGAKIVELDSDGFHYTRTLGPRWRTCPEVYVWFPFH